MRVLAIETVGTTGTLALLERQRVLRALELDRTQRSAQTLAPGIQQLLEQAGWRAADVELVAVATGPGSFTGLRIGVTTAKVFAYATGCQVIGVGTMAAIASRVPDVVLRFSVILDAQRGEVFVADFARVDDQLLEQQTTRVEPVERWIAELPPNTVVSGPGLTKYASRLDGRAVIVAPQRWAPTAEAVGRLGWQCFATGERVSPFELLPQYFRRTAAEEQRERRDQDANAG